MSIRNKDEEITYEVTVKGGKYSCVLRNFYTGGGDYEIRNDFPLAEGLEHASKDNILERTYDDTISFYAEAYRRQSKNCEDVEKKETYKELAEALDTLDYDKIKKDIHIERN